MTDGSSPVVVNAHYKLNLISVVTFFSCLISLPVLAMAVSEPTDLQKDVIGVLDFVLKSTLGAMLGLVGAKMTT